MPSTTEGTRQVKPHLCLGFTWGFRTTSQRPPLQSFPTRLWGWIRWGQSFQTRQAVTLTSGIPAQFCSWRETSGEERRHFPILHPPLPLRPSPSASRGPGAPLTSMLGSVLLLSLLPSPRMLPAERPSHW